jgi:hypothetical protein
MIDKLFPYTGLLGALALIAAAGSLYVLVQVMRKASRPRIYLLALGLAMLSSLFYGWSTEYWFSVVKLDRTEEMQKALADQKKAEAEALAQERAEAAERGEEVGTDAVAPPKKTGALAAGMTFAEDSPDDLKQGGYSDATPTWREGGKKVRTLPSATNNLAGARGTNHLAGARGTNHLAGARGTNHLAGVGGTNHLGGAGDDSASLDADEEAEKEKAEQLAKEGAAENNAIYLKGPQLRVVNQIHRLSGMAINLLLIAVLMTILWNYVVTFNAPWNTWWPLPLSGEAIDAFSPKRPTQALRPGDKPYAPPEVFLGRALRKGENVIYFGQRPIWESMPAVPRLSLFIPWFGDHADTVWPKTQAYLLLRWQALVRMLARGARFALNHWNRIAPSWHRRVQATTRFLERMDDRVQTILGDGSRFFAQLTATLKRRSLAPGMETAGAAARQSLPQRLACAGRSLWQGTAALALTLALALARLGLRLWQDRGAWVQRLERLAQWMDDREAHLFRVLPHVLERLGQWARMLLRVLGVVGRWLGNGAITWPPQLVRYVRLLRRGERQITFVEIPLWRVPIIRYGGSKLPTGSEFAFDAAWFGRYVPIMSGDAPCREMLKDMADIMSERRQSGAVAKRTLLIVWDRDEVIDDALQTHLAQLAEEGNLSILTWQRGP